MNDQTLVAIYDTAEHADAAVRDLRADGVPADAISQHANDSGTAGASRTSATTTSPARDQGFWSNLFGGHPDHDTAVYDRSIESGSTVVTVRTPNEHFDRVSSILEKHNPVDYDERSARYGATETTTTRTTTAPGTGVGATANGGDTIQLAEESLSVGKRAVSGGTTRIRLYVVETPVEEQVNLHSERVTMERRPVTDGRPVGAADFTDRSIEMTETSEEAVVSKTARVTEEVSLHRESTDRVETIKDTVRRDDVKIEQVPGAQTTGRTGTTPVDPNRAKI